MHGYPGVYQAREDFDMRLMCCVVALLGFVCAANGEQFLLVSNHQGGDSVSRYNLAGDWQGYFVAPGSGGLSRAVGLQMGADGDLYVASEGTGQVLRYNGQTGAFKDVFADAAQLSGIGYMTFGPDGDLYASGAGINSVLRIDGQTGVITDLAGAGGGLSGPDGIAFSGGEMLVSSYFTNSIKRYNPVSGAYLGDFVAAGGLVRPLELTIAGGELRVVSQGTNSIRRYDIGSGAYIGDLLSGGGLFNPIAQAELPNGNRVVSSYSNSSLIEFDSAGQLVGVFASGIGEGLASPTNMLLVPAPGGVFVLGGVAVVGVRRRRG